MRRRRDIILILIAVIASLGSSLFFSSTGTGAAVEQRRHAPTAAVHTWIYPNNKVAISSTIYGVNNDCRQIPRADFPAFDAKLHGLGYQLLRFPGGWESEHFNWVNDTAPGYSNLPCVTAAQAKGAVAAKAFVVKTELYISDPSPAHLSSLKSEAADLVRKHGNAVRHWLIGNEWWLQSGGGVGRPKKLRRYATVARAIAQGMKQVNPRINVYVTGDWTRPWEFTWIRREFEPSGAWRYVDGVDLHIYAGDDGSIHDYRNIQRNLGAIKSRTGKSKIFASEWAASEAYSVGHERALRSVNNMVILMYRMIRAGVTSMAYWPPTDVAPGIGLFEKKGGVYADLPHCQAFRWMAREMRGYAIATTATDGLETTASNNVAGKTMTVMIPSKQLFNRKIVVHFVRTKIASVVSAQAMWMADLDSIGQAARISPLRVGALNGTVTVTANPGTVGRRSSYELIKLVVRYQ